MIDVDFDNDACFYNLHHLSAIDVELTAKNFDAFV